MGGLICGNCFWAQRAGLAFSVSAGAGDPDPAKWDDVLNEARGETVYFNAWGGAGNINAYLEWSGD